MSFKILNFFKYSVLAMILIYTIVSFLSYSPFDNAINVYSVERISNLGGSFGALISDLVYQYIGFSIFSIFFFCILSRFSIRQRSTKYIFFILSFFSSIIFFTCYTNVNDNWIFDNYSGLLGVILKFYIPMNLYIYFDYISYISCLIFFITNYFLLISLSKTIVMIRRYVKVISKTITKLLRIIIIFVMFFFLCIKKSCVIVKKIYFLIRKKPLLLTVVNVDKEEISRNKQIYNMNNNMNNDMYNIDVIDNVQKKNSDYSNLIEELQIDDTGIDTNNMDRDKGEYEDYTDNMNFDVINNDVENNVDDDIDRFVLSDAKIDESNSKGIDFEIKLPNTNFLTVSKNNMYCTEDLDKKAGILEQTLLDFGVKGVVKHFYVGPVVTRYEFEPIAGTKSSRVIALAGDLARSMKAKSARVSVITGKDALGVELPNENRETVYLKDLLESEEYISSKFDLPIALGKGIDGKPIIVDLAKMPHLLIAGTTGSGKSVGVNAMILSLLYKLKPEICRFIFIDPKMLELSVYDNIPNLLAPVVTNPKKAIVTLKWVVLEMERRYKIMSKLGVRSIKGFNKIVIESQNKGSSVILQKSLKGFDKISGEKIYENYECNAEIMPFIIVVVDEMADLMIVAGKEIESSIQRLAQMARAAGIHIIMATQRPSVDVITGVIKANFPTRISFSVSSRIDSRTILGEQGAEQLLGMGDMLYMSPGLPIQRIHAPFVSDKEVNRVVSYLRVQGQVDYISELKDIIIEEGLNTCMSSNSIGNIGSLSYADSSDDELLYNKAIEIILNDEKVSISYIQRQLKIGYNRAANIIERMENEGVISKPNSIGKRDILIKHHNV